MGIFDDKHNKQFYDGYVRTSAKKARHGFKNPDQRKTFAQVQSLEEYGGVLRDDIIMVDIDDNLVLLCPTCHKHADKQK